MDMNMNNKDRLNELLFENRNKNYGAYVIRKNYDRRLMVSSMITLSIIVLAMFAPKMFTGVKEIVAINSKPETKVRVIPIELTPKVQPPKSTPKSTPTKKGTALGTPTPTDSTVNADTTTFRFVGDPGDPKGKDTTDTGIKGTGGNTITVVVPPKEKITSFPDVNPEFPGGMEGLANFIRKNMKYPRVALEDGIKGTIYLSFVVDEDGKVIDIKNLNNLGGGLDKEAVRVASLMPNWKPGMLGGEKISVRYNLPVKFTFK